jgi:hypothetical protein
MRAVIDADRPPLERWKGMREADMAVAWDAHLGGWPVALLGIESRPQPRHGPVPADGPDQWTSGTLFPLASKKIARAINAASGRRPSPPARRHARAISTPAGDAIPASNRIRCPRRARTRATPNNDSCAPPGSSVATTRTTSTHEPCAAKPRSHTLTQRYPRLRRPAAPQPPSSAHGGRTPASFAASGLGLHDGVGVAA